MEVWAPGIPEYTKFIGASPGDGVPAMLSPDIPSARERAVFAGAVKSRRTHELIRDGHGQRGRISRYFAPTYNPFTLAYKQQKKRNRITHSYPPKKNLWVAP